MRWGSRRANEISNLERQIERLRDDQRAADQRFRKIEWEMWGRDHEAAQCLRRAAKLTNALSAKYGGEVALAKDAPILVDLLKALADKVDPLSEQPA